MPHEHMRGRLTEVADIRAFALAGNATLTLVSKKTGVRYTYKIRQCVDNRGAANEVRKELWFVSVMYGPDNETDFTYIGTIRPHQDGGLAYLHGRKSTVPASDVRTTGFNWFWSNIEYKKAAPSQLEVWHEGKCCRCGRKLTVPESIARGIGPECIKHFNQGDLLAA